MVTSTAITHRCRQKPREYRTAQATVTYVMCNNLHAAKLDTSTGYDSITTGQTRHLHTTIQLSTTKQKT